VRERERERENSHENRNFLPSRDQNHFRKQLRAVRKQEHDILILRRVMLGVQINSLLFISNTDDLIDSKSPVYHSRLINRLSDNRDHFVD